MTISQIAKTIGCLYDDVYKIILKTKLTPAYYNKSIRLYSKCQINLIYKLLYFERKCTFEIIESKINKNQQK